MADSDNQHHTERHAARLRGFKWHLAAYFLAMAVLVPANILTTPESPWFVWPMVGWGAILALHVAWTIGLFDILSRRD